VNADPPQPTPQIPIHMQFLKKSFEHDLHWNPHSKTHFTFQAHNQLTALKDDELYKQPMMHDLGFYATLNFLSLINVFGV
jgi:hypothetical protein